MSARASLAARMGDEVGAHASAEFAKLGMNIGALAGAALGAVLIGAAVAGAIAISATGVGVVVGAVLILAAVAGTVALTAGLASAGGRFGQAYDHDHEARGPPCSSIVTGYAGVVIESRAAARVGDEVRHGLAKLRQGSASVLVGGRPASRQDDEATCDGKVVTFARSTVIGGPTKSEGPRAQDETDAELDRLEHVAKMAGYLALGLAFGAAAVAGFAGLVVAGASVAAGLATALAVGTVLSLTGAAVGTGVGWAIDKARGHKDQRYQHLLGAVGGVVGGAMTGRAMAFGRGFFAPRAVIPYAPPPAETVYEVDSFPFELRHPAGGRIKGQFWGSEASGERVFHVKIAEADGTPTSPSFRDDIQQGLLNRARAAGADELRVYGPDGRLVGTARVPKAALAAGPSSPEPPSTESEAPAAESGVVAVASRPAATPSAGGTPAAAAAALPAAASPRAPVAMCTTCVPGVVAAPPPPVPLASPAVAVPIRAETAGAARPGHKVPVLNLNTNPNDSLSKTGPAVELFVDADLMINAHGGPEGIVIGGYTGEGSGKEWVTPEGEPTGRLTARQILDRLPPRTVAPDEVEVIFVRACLSGNWAGWQEVANERNAIILAPTQLATFFPENRDYLSRIYPQSIRDQGVENFYGKEVDLEPPAPTDPKVYPGLSPYEDTDPIDGSKVTKYTRRTPTKSEVVAWANRQDWERRGDSWYDANGVRRVRLRTWSQFRKPHVELRDERGTNVDGAGTPIKARQSMQRLGFSSSWKDEEPPPPREGCATCTVPAAPGAESPAIPVDATSAVEDGTIWNGSKPAPEASPKLTQKVASAEIEGASDAVGVFAEAGVPVHADSHLPSYVEPEVESPRDAAGWKAWRAAYDNATFAFTDAKTAYIDGALADDVDDGKMVALSLTSRVVEGKKLPVGTPPSRVVFVTGVERNGAGKPVYFTIDDPSAGGPERRVSPDLLSTAMSSKAWGVVSDERVRPPTAAGSRLGAEPKCTTCSPAAVDGPPHGPPSPEVQAQRQAIAREVFPGGQTDGTCALQSIRQIIKVRNGSMMTEAEIKRWAFENHLASEDGGVKPLGDADIFRALGVPADHVAPTPLPELALEPNRYPELPELVPGADYLTVMKPAYDDYEVRLKAWKVVSERNDALLEARSEQRAIFKRELVMKTIPDALDDGKGVVATVDTRKPFWDFDETGGAHAIWVTGVVRGPDGQPTDFIFNDTGSGEQGRTMKAEDFLKAVREPGFFTVTRDRIW